jgi:peroxisomal enoyl-CoA hydratase 2
MQPSTVTVSWNRLDTRVYNASIGLGADEHDEPYVDMNPNVSSSAPARLSAYPTLPLGMLHRNAPPTLAPWRDGSTAALTEYAVFDPAALVHGDQTIVWARGVEVPIAASAEVRHDVVAISQKPTGVVLSAASTFTVNNETLCTSFASMFLRNGRLTPKGEALADTLRRGRAKPTPEVREALGLVARAAKQGVTAENATSVTFRLAPNQAAQYAINSDDNPLHVSHGVARQVGFKAPILHGLCTFAYAARAAQRVVAATHRVVDLRTVRPVAVTGRFARPVYPGATLRVEVSPVASQDATSSLVTVAYRVLAEGPGADIPAPAAKALLVISHGAAVFDIGAAAAVPSKL